MAGRTRTPCRVCAGQHLLAQLGVTIEASAREDDAAVDADCPSFTVVEQRHCLRARGASDDFRDRSVDRQRDVPSLRERIQQPADQGVAHHQARAARVPHPVGQLAAQYPRGVLERGERLVIRNRWKMSLRSTIMPPSTVNSGIGGRISASSLPSLRPSNGSGSSARPFTRRPFEFAEIVGMERVGAELHLGLAST